MAASKWIAIGVALAVLHISLDLLHEPHSEQVVFLSAAIAIVIFMLVWKG